MPEIRRGATAQFATNFYDFDQKLVQPGSAFVNVDYPDSTDNRVQIDLAMAPGSTSQPWTAKLDTRGMGLGMVYWSVHTSLPLPCAVAEGQFMLIGNPANLATF